MCRVTISPEEKKHNDWRVRRASRAGVCVRERECESLGDCSANSLSLPTPTVGRVCFPNSLMMDLVM